MVKLKDDKLKIGARLIIDTVNNMRKCYKYYTEDGRDRFENQIGGLLFAMPSSTEELWCGGISLGVLDLIINKKQGKGDRIAPDHIFSRKKSSNELINIEKRNLTEDNLIEAYRIKYGKYALVTARENIKLKTYQGNTQDFDPNSTYRNAGVLIIKISDDERKQIINKRNIKVCKKIKNEYLDGNPDRILVFEIPEVKFEKPSIFNKFVGIGSILNHNESDTTPNLVRL